MTSQNLVSKFGSRDSLKVRVRWGLISLAAQIRCTLAGDTPVWRAIERTLQRVRFGGGCVACVMMRSFVASGIDGFGPRPGASSNPARP